MSSSDLMVYSVLAVLAAAPYLQTLVLQLWDRVANAVPTLPAPAPAHQDATLEAWRQNWSATLISFLDSIEAADGLVEDEAKAARLARELIWEIIGGDGQQAGKK